MFEMQYTYFIILAPATAIAGILIAIQAWSQKENPGVTQFTAAMLMAVGWVLFNSLELLALTPEYTFFWAKVTYLFITTTPVTFFLFATQFFWKEKWLRPSLIPVLYIIPLITNLIIWQPNLTPLIWQDIHFKMIGSRFLILQVSEYGIWFWVYTTYLYSLTTISMLMIFNYIFRASILYRQQSIWIFLGVVFPSAFNLIYIFKLIPGLQKDFTPISFALSGLMIAMGIFRFRLFDLSPMAREVIVDKMGDGFILADRFDRIVDMNPAAATIFQVEINPLLGQPIETVLADWGKLSKDINAEQLDYTIQVKQNNQDTHYELKISKLQNNRNIERGTIVLLRDVTERVHLLEEVRQLATQDDLTKIFNRRHFYELAQRIYAQAVRYHHNISILLIDLDHFKSINDTYGHKAGDLVLQHFAATCAKNIRQSDILARFGGEEFIILLPETNAPNALVTAERLKSEIDAMTIQWQNNSINFSISVGIACLPAGAEPILLDVLIDQADQALYHAKENGRNQVALASKVLT